MLAAVSEATWAFLGVLITQAVIFAGLFVRSTRTGRDVAQINRAVNHQPDGSPTLVERVGRIEARTEVIESDTKAHRDWEHSAFSAIADQIGVALPPHPKEHR